MPHTTAFNSNTRCSQWNSAVVQQRHNETLHRTKKNWYIWHLSHEIIYKYIDIKKENKEWNHKNHETIFIDWIYRKCTILDTQYMTFFGHISQPCLERDLFSANMERSSLVCQTWVSIIVFPPKDTCHEPNVLHCVLFFFITSLHDIERRAAFLILIASDLLRA